jgi:hypothetical protein
LRDVCCDDGILLVILLGLQVPASKSLTRKAECTPVFGERVVSGPRLMKGDCGRDTLIRRLRR